VSGEEQLPQLNVPPHPSDGAPQLSPSEAQVAGTQPQWNGVTAPQVRGDVQDPQLSVPPQPSDGLPQLSPNDAQVAGTQPQWNAVTAPQVCGEAHVPQLKVPPHPSAGLPQLSPRDAQVAATQPQWKGVTAPQVWGAVHVPQLKVPPHPFDGAPQLSPSAAQFVGVQPQWNATPPPPHDWGDAQVPQLSVPPHPSGGPPQLSPNEPQVAATQPQWNGVTAPHVCGATQDPQLKVPPHPSDGLPQLSPSVAHVAAVHPQTFGVPPPPQVYGAVQAFPVQQAWPLPPHPEHVSSVVRLVDFVHEFEVHSALVVHWTHAPYFTSVDVVSQYGVVPVQPKPTSAQVHFRQPAGVVGVPTQIGVTFGFAEMQAPRALLHCVCTTQVSDPTVMVACWALQMSPISPHVPPVAYQAIGRDTVAVKPMSVSVIDSKSSWERTEVALFSDAASFPQPVTQVWPVMHPAANMSGSTPYAMIPYVGSVKVLW
jgi:hypothetical protein